MQNPYEIAVIYGDGIGPEIGSATVEVLKASLKDDNILNFIEYPAGAQCFLDTGTAFPEMTLEGCRRADAILHGAAGLPNVLYSDGTEAGQDFSLNLRFKLDIYANVRYVKAYEGVPIRLAGKRPKDIDYVVMRENTEGLYASRGAGSLLRDKVATENLIITREGTERIARSAFELARKRKGAPLDGKKRVTVCDKANVLRSYAFFRRVCSEIAEEYPDIELDFFLVDAMAAYLVTRPEYYDVIVVENMFGDIISDLGPATAGGLGLSPTAELGTDVGYFQAAHGSAPDIAGQDLANPVGTILAGALMLEWLGDLTSSNLLLEAANRIRNVVENLYAEKLILTSDLGGSAKTSEVTAAICQALA
jgi:3-isopropylmalate dehydrogenase